MHCLYKKQLGMAVFLFKLREDVREFYATRFKLRRDTRQADEKVGWSLYFKKTKNLLKFRN
jgi:hypothetical protein